VTQQGPLARWVAAVQEELGLAVDADRMSRLVLDLARDVAHSVDRPAAPVTAYLLGLAAGQAAAGQAADPDQATGAEPGTGPDQVTGAGQRAGLNQVTGQATDAGQAAGPDQVTGQVTGAEPAAGPNQVTGQVSGAGQGADPDQATEQAAARIRRLLQGWSPAE